MINAVVKGQGLKINHPKVVADTIAYLEMSVDFRTEDWDGLVKFVHFALGDEHYTFELVDDKITQDMHLDLPEGEWEVYIHGSELQGGEVVQRITTEPVTLFVYRTGSLDGEPFPELSGSVGEQTIAKANEAIKIAKSAEKAAKRVEDTVNNVAFVGESTNDVGGEIFNTYEDDDSGEYVRVRNIALSVAATAHGNGTVAGCMAFRLLGSRDIETDDGVVGVYLLDSVGGIEIGDEFSIKYKSNYDCCGKVIAIGPAGASSLGYVLDENEIAVEGNVINDPAYDPEEHDAPVLWFYHKPTIGTTPWGTGQHASGDNNKAVGPQSSSEGRNNVSAGRYAHTEGKDNFAVYAAHAQGRQTKALNECSDTAGFGTEARGYASHAGGNRTRADGNQSHTGGTKTVARGENAFAHGSSCEADGVNSAAFGQGTKATKKNQFVGGAYNEVRDDAVAIWGNGSADEPSNAMVVLDDGSVEVGKQGLSGNSVVLKGTLDAVVKQGCIQDEVTANNVAVITPDMVGGCTVTALNTGAIRKFGINLLKTNKTYNRNGIVTSLDSEQSGIIINGEATITLYEVQAAYYSIYFPAGHYTFFMEGLDSKHSSDNVYFRLLGLDGAGKEKEIARINSTNSMVEFDISEAVSMIRVKAFIKTGESFDDEHIKFQLQAGTKTEFTPYKAPVTVEVVAGEETTIVVDDLSPFTLVSQTEGNIITCKYPVSTKGYVDSKMANVMASKQYELIEEITLDEAVASFTRNMDTNGKPYNLSAIRVKVRAPAAEGATQNTQIIFHPMNAAGNSIVYHQVTGGLATSAKASYFVARNDSGLIDYYTVVSTINNMGARYMRDGYIIRQWTNIAKLNISTYPTTVLIPAGTTITIYGIKEATDES